MNHRYFFLFATLCLFLWRGNVVAQFTDIGANLPPAANSAAAWGDYDNDGDLDILISGSNFTKIFRNDNAIFSDIGANLPGLVSSAVAWGDYDNDGDLDIALAGMSGSGEIAKIYRNDNGMFTDIGAGFPGVQLGSVSWADYDNDGDLDLLVTGVRGSVPSTALYRNDHGVFVSVATALPQLAYSKAVWGDYDNDGDLDVLMTGKLSTKQLTSTVYKNTNGVFTSINANLVGSMEAMAAWGDYDNDGDLDIILCGAADTNSTTFFSRIYKNTNGVFQDINALITPSFDGSVAWGDYDNDGDIDILITGYSASGYISKIYRNNSGSFGDINAGLSGVVHSSAVWGDFDNDGDLDFLLTGMGSSQNYSLIYRNNSTIANTRPTAPQNLSATIAKEGVTFKWNKSTDAETPQKGLRYNLLLGTTRGGLEKVSPMANTITGFRRLPALVNVGDSAKWKVLGLPDAKYYYSIQGVDNAFTGSQFAPVESVTVNSPRFSGTPSTINFQSVEIGRIKTDSVLVTNLGTDTLKITTVAVTNNNFVVTPPGNVSIPSQTTRAFKVQFNPSGTGFKQGKVIFTHNGAYGTLDTVNVSGTGLQLTVTATTDGNGTIAPTGTVNVLYGAIQRFTYTPRTDYHVSTVKIDGALVDSLKGYTFYNITASHTIAVTYTIKRYTITASTGTHGTVLPIGAVSVDSNSSTRFLFTPDIHYRVNSVQVDNIFRYYDSLTGYTFINVKANHTISVTFKYFAYTITASAGSNGTISPSGVALVDSGANVRFTFSPTINYHVDTLRIDGIRVDSSSGYTFIKVKSNHTIMVTFCLYRFSLVATAGAHGSIFPSGTAYVNFGGSQRFTFVPNARYRIDTVLVDGISVDSTVGYTFVNVVSNHSISATYRYYQYTITASAGSNGSIVPSGVVPVDSASTKRFLFTHTTGYRVRTVLVDGSNVDSSIGYTFGNIKASHLISVSFDIVRFSITAMAGEHGMITPSGIIQANYGTSLLCTFIPGPGYMVDTVFINGIPVDSTKSFTFQFIQSDSTIAVKFTILRYTITATSGPNGSISPAGVTRGDSGFTQRYLFIPNSGFHADSVYVDAVYVDSSDGYTFFYVSKNHTIAVRYKVNQFVVVATAGANGSIFPSGIVAMDSNSTKRFRIVPNTGYHVDSVFADGIRVDSSTNYSFINVRANHTLSVKFKINMYVISTSVGLHGNITPSGVLAVPYGSDKRFKFIPDPEYRCDTVWVDGIRVDSTNGYTFANITKNHSIELIFTSADSTRYRTFNQKQLSEKAVKVKLKGRKLVFPTYGNIRDSIYEEGYPNGTVMLLGFQRKDSARSYGWVTFKGGKGKGKIFTKILPMTLTAQPLTNKGELRNPSIKKLNNTLVGELITLRMNIIGSDYGVTTPESLDQKFGDLYYEEQSDSATVYFDKTIRELALMSDSVLTYATRVHDGNVTALWSIIKKINEAFASPDEFSMNDTASFIKGGMRIRGYKMMRDVPFLRRDAGFIPRSVLANITAAPPDVYTLSQNYPNPFNPVTSIAFSLPVVSNVTLNVYNVLGQKAVTILNNQSLQEGEHILEFDASGLSSGVYFYTLQTGNISITKKLLLLR